MSIIGKDICAACERPLVGKNHHCEPKDLQRVNRRDARRENARRTEPHYGQRLSDGFAMLGGGDEN